MTNHFTTNAEWRAWFSRQMLQRETKQPTAIDRSRSVVVERKWISGSELLTDAGKLSYTRPVRLKSRASLRGHGNRPR